MPLPGQHLEARHRSLGLFVLLSWKPLVTVSHAPSTLFFSPKEKNLLKGDSRAGVPRSHFENQWPRAGGGVRSEVSGCAGDPDICLVPFLNVTFALAGCACDPDAAGPGAFPRGDRLPSGKAAPGTGLSVNPCNPFCSLWLEGRCRGGEGHSAKSRRLEFVPGATDSQSRGCSGQICVLRGALGPCAG